MHRVVQVRLRESGRVRYYNCGRASYPVGEYVVVEADRGEDYGLVMSEPETTPDAEVEQPLRNVLRPLNPADRERIKGNRREGRAA